MWCPSLRSAGKVAVAGMLLLTAGNAEACLFPCLWGGGGGYYAPAPMYGAPVYGGPAYAPSPCGPGGCGPGGCSSYYGPTACCSPCGGGCSPCGAGCSTCSGGACDSGNCGVNYSSNLNPTPDRGRTKEKTYSPNPAEQPPTPADMEEDDFLPPAHGGDGATGGATSSPAAQPMPDAALPDKMTLHVLPVRQRTNVRAQYRVPRVARLQVSPQTDWLPVAEGRLARR